MPAELSPVAVWRVTRTDQPAPGNLVGWGTAATIEAAARQGVDFAVDATFFGGHQITYSDLNDDERAVVDATFVNPITVEVRDFTVETMWDHTSLADLEAARAAASSPRRPWSESREDIRRRRAANR